MRIKHPILRYPLTALWYIFVAAVVLAAVVMSTARILMPLAGNYRAEAEQLLTEYAGQPIRVSDLQAEWHGLGPQLRLIDVRLMDSDEQRMVLRFDEARMGISLLDSVKQGKFVPSSLTVIGADLSLERHTDGSISVRDVARIEGEATEEYTGLVARWLFTQPDLRIEKSDIVWGDEETGVEGLHFQDVHLRIRNDRERHQIDGTVDLPPDLGGSFRFAIDLQGNLLDPVGWVGKLYVHGKQVVFRRWWGDTLFGDIGIDEGRATFRVWSEWQAGRLTRLDGEFDAFDVAFKTVADEQTLVEQMSGKLIWERLPNGWVVYMDDVNVARNGGRWPATHFYITALPDEEFYEARFGFIRLEDVAQLVPVMQRLEPETREIVQALQPTGDLSDILVRYSGRRRNENKFLLEAKFSDLRFMPWNELPGVSGMTGHLRSDSNGGEVALDCSRIRLDYDRLFRKPVQLDRLVGQVRWNREEKGWRVRSRDLAASSTDLELDTNFSLHIPYGGGSPHVDLVAGFKNVRGTAASDYYPVAFMPDDVVKWLDRAIGGGRVSQGGVVLRGRLEDFPFRKKEGTFEVRFDVENLDLDYEPGWPKITGINASAWFSGQRMEIKGTGGKVFDSRILDATAVIEEVGAKEPVLKISGRVQGNTGDALRFVKESPIGESYADRLKRLEVSGASVLDLDLMIPLSDRPNQVQGSIALEDNHIRMEGTDVLFRDATGTMEFTQDRFSVHEMDARMWGRPVRISIRGGEARKGGRSQPGLEVSVRGRFDVATLDRELSSSLGRFMDGEADWTVQLDVPDITTERTLRAQLVVESDLKGIDLRLPPPLSKAAGEAKPLKLATTLGETPSRRLELAYGEQLRSVFRLGARGDTTGIARGELRFGGGAAQLPQAKGIRVTGTFPWFSLYEWWQFASDLQGQPGGLQKPGGAYALAERVNLIDVQVGTLQLFEQRFDQVALKAARSPESWVVELDAPSIAGTVQIPHDLNLGSVEMQLARLHLPELVKGDKGVLDPRDLPSIRADVEHFRYKETDLGRAKLQTSRNPAGLYMDTLAFDSPAGRIHASGDWLVQEGAHSTRVDVDVSAEDLGDFLEMFGYAGNVEGGRTRGEFQVQWDGAPSQFSLAKLNGVLTLNIRDGRVLVFGPGAGRVFGLLSLQALPRRLTLDFSDLFKKGFTFDRISGTFDLEAGHAYTRDAVIEGPSARIDILGRTGLVTRDYDQSVTVTPKVTASLPVAGALVGGPLAGGVLFAFEKLFRPQIDEITRYRYTITGSWDDPNVQRLE